jgi:membrane protease YdiL (CAAX protease family)
MMSRRAVAAAEALVAAAVVIGHNILRVVPNEVVVLVLFGAVSCAIRRQSLTAIGYRSPVSWSRTAAVALCVALALQAFSILVVDPLAIRFTGETADLSDFQPVVGNLKLAAIYLLLIWSFAAFGEEFAYRGYLLRRTIEAFGGFTRGSVAAVLLCAALFGVGHYYQGLVGMIDSTVSGLVFGTLYVRSGGNLWPSTLAHGFTDTLALVLIASGAVQI